MSRQSWNDLRLLDELVSSFGCWDELVVGYDLEQVTGEFAAGPEDESGFRHWQPVRIDTPPAALDSLYALLPVRLPQLYERLILSYRWATVELDQYSLLANPPGPDFTRLFQVFSLDSGLWEALLPAGYIQFGRGPDMDYDPVCFDLRRGLSDYDCRIVKIDHEWILCHYRVVEVAELAPSFRELVWQTTEKAGEKVAGRR
jgi:hypothetical protein